MNSIYADYNSTSPLLKEVENCLVPWSQKYFGNPSNLHRFGQASKGAISQSRKQLASLTSLPADQLFFTSGGTESNVSAILGFLQADTSIEQVLVSAVEHSSVFGLEESIVGMGRAFLVIPVDENGLVDLDFIAHECKSKKTIVSVMFANNETGVIQPVKEIASLVHKYKGLYHCDAVQGLGKVSQDYSDIEADSFSFSGHKLGALKGVGALFIEKSIPFKSIFGGGSQEASKRPGTENLLGILSFGKACELKKAMLKECESSCRDYFEDQLKSLFDVMVLGESVARVYNTSDVIFKNRNHDILLAGLDMKGVSASAGSACKANASSPSHVLKAMGLNGADLKAVVRFSFGTSCKEECDQIIEILKELIPTK